MILFTCECGAHLHAEDEQKGKFVSCHACNRNRRVPSASEESLCLVYSKAISERPVVMPREEVLERLREDELSPTKDMIWVGDHWELLTDVTDESRQSLNFEEVAAREPERELAEESEKRKSPRFRIAHIVQLVVAVLAIVFGYKFGVGPLISKIREQPTYVLVQSHEDVEYEAVLGWRRLKQRVYPVAVAKFELFVGMPEKQTLVLTPVRKGDGEEAPPEAEPVEIEVPLRAGSAILVNVNQEGTYATFEPGEVADVALSSEARLVANQIAALRDPTKAETLARKMGELGEEAMIETSNQLFYRSRNYDLSRLTGMTGGRSEEEEGADPGKPILVGRGHYPINFKNGSLNFAFQEPDKVQGHVDLPQVTVEIPNNLAFKLPKNTTLRVDRNAQRLRIHMRLNNRRAKIQGAAFRGAWNYEARKKQNGDWNWNWKYEGTAGKKGRKVKATVTVDARGRVKTDLNRP